MNNERKIYIFKNTLQLENYIKELRIAHVKSYLSDKIDLRDLAEEDLMAVYTLLQTKDDKNLKKRLDEIRKM